ASQLQNPAIPRAGDPPAGIAESIDSRCLNRAQGIKPLAVSTSFVQSERAAIDDSVLGGCDQTPPTLLARRQLVDNAVGWSSTTTGEDSNDTESRLQRRGVVHRR